MYRAEKNKKTTVILGGGLAGLSSGYVLTRAGYDVAVLEKDSAVGGLSKTIEKNGFRFDLGGHRFFTRDERLNTFVRELMGSELLSVHRTSKIYMRNRYFDYPLKPFNAMFGLGIPTTLKIVADYGLERLKRIFSERDNISLEDWVVSNFGRTMFDIYFKGYSEKVWGIECSDISAEWVARRISGLSLSKAIRNAFFRFSGRDLPTLADTFDYPAMGIGRISERLREEIERFNPVYTETCVRSVHHCGCRIEGVTVNSQKHPDILFGREFISSMPLTRLIQSLDPAPPGHIMEAASRLRFRDLVVVAIMVDRERVTDQTWIYVPEKKIPFGRLHEPTNWSGLMAPEGKTLVVTEFFCFRGDATWNAPDERLIDITVENLEKIGFLRRHEVIEGMAVRVPRAYPLFEVGYQGLCEVIYDYLSRFENLHLTGRGGMFRYYNMDHALESGIETAERIMKKNPGSSQSSDIDDRELVFAGDEECDAH
ncbi:MAG: FAD-dependent oxidoreductase [Nitrospirae bacterium]|nr:FAD-dependent oxidoreductase [Nitrospirota bacterium]